MRSWSVVRHVGYAYHLNSSYLQIPGLDDVAHDLGTEMRFARHRRVRAPPTALGQYSIVSRGGGFDMHRVVRRPFTNIP